MRQGFRVGLRTADLKGDGVRIIIEVDARLIRRVGFGHLFRAVAEAHDPCRGAEDQRLDLGKECHVVVVIELVGDVVGEFQVLALIIADRNARGVIGKHVGGHEIGINVETGGRILPILAGLVLELGHAVEPADPCDAVEDPGELGMRADVGLHEQDMAAGIDAGGQQHRRHFPGLAGERGGVLPDGDGVQVHHAP